MAVQQCQLMSNTFFLISSDVSDDKLFLMCELLESWTVWNKNIFPLSIMKMSLPSSQHAEHLQGKVEIRSGPWKQFCIYKVLKNWKTG